MKDEWNNECPYDFKNIQFKRYPIISMSDGSTELVFDVNNQKMKYAIKKPWGIAYPGGAIVDENNVSYYFTFNAILQNSETYNIYDASVVQKGIKINGGGDFVVQNNKINEAHTSSYDSNGYGQALKLNNIVINNVIDSLVYTGGSYGCYFNTFGDDCYDNTFGNGYQYNMFGINCYSNTFGNECRSNTFGNICYYNTFGNGCQYNTFGNGCRFNTFGGNCGYNTFVGNCGGNTFGNSCSFNMFSNSCDNNRFYTGTSGTTKKDFIRYIVLEDGCRNNNFYSILTTSNNNYLQRIRIKGLGDDDQTNIQITLSTVNTKYEWVIAKNSSNVIKQYCPEDLV